MGTIKKSSSIKIKDQPEHFLKPKAGFGYFPIFVCKTIFLSNLYMYKYM